MRMPAFLLWLGLWTSLNGCQHYPEHMTASERKKYYDDYNRSQTPAQWDSTRSARKEQEKREATQDLLASVRSPASVAFSIKNNSLFTQRVKIRDNRFTFHLFERRYVAFPVGTKVYLDQDQQPAKYLFTVTAADSGKTFSLFGKQSARNASSK